MTTPAPHPALRRESRRDRGILRRAHLTPGGFLRAEGVGALAGVHEYRLRGPDGKPRIIRELLDIDTLQQDAGQIGGLPLLLLHRIDGKPSTPENLRKRRRDEEPQPGDYAGVVGDDVEVIKDAQGGYVKLRILTQTSDARQALRSGQAAELSFGYDVEIDPTPGVHPLHGPYDQRQVSRRYDHLALVPQARHGSEARLRADEEEGSSAGFDLAALLGLQITPRRLDTLAATPQPPRPGRGASLMTFLQRLALQMQVRADGLTEEGLQQALLQRADTLNDLDTAAASLPRPEGRADMSAPELIRDMCAMHEREKKDLAEQLAAATAEKEAAEGERDGYHADLMHYRKAEAEAEAEKKMDSLKAIAEAVQVPHEEKSLEALRADCAAAILGNKPANYTAAHYDGLFAPILARLQAGEPPLSRDPRYDAFREGAGEGSDSSRKDSPTPRPSLRSAVKARRDSLTGGRS